MSKDSFLISSPEQVQGFSLEEIYRKLANKKLRRLVRQMIKNYDKVKLFPNIRDISNIWSFGKDGKHYYIPTNKYSIGDEDKENRFKKMMRK